MWLSIASLFQLWIHLTGIAFHLYRCQIKYLHFYWYIPSFPFISHFHPFRFSFVVKFLHIGNFHFIYSIYDINNDLLYISEKFLLIWLSVLALKIYFPLTYFTIITLLIFHEKMKKKDLTSMSESYFYGLSDKRCDFHG